MVAVSELVCGLDAELVRLEAVNADVVTADLAEWNQDPELLSWLASLQPAWIMCSVQPPAPPLPASTAGRCT